MSKRARLWIDYVLSFCITIGVIGTIAAVILGPAYPVTIFGWVFRGLVGMLVLLIAMVFGILLRAMVLDIVDHNERYRGLLSSTFRGQTLYPATLALVIFAVVFWFYGWKIALLTGLAFYLSALFAMYVWDYRKKKEVAESDAFVVSEQKKAGHYVSPQPSQ